MGLQAITKHENKYGSLRQLESTPSRPDMASSNWAFASLGEHANLPHCRSHTQTALLAQSRRTPTTCQARRDASLSDSSADLPQLLRDVSTGSTTSSDTILYLGYGSNLSAETFRGKRNIKPISQVNVVVPSISLTFDLPGVPYAEPCFGNCAYREIPSPKHENSSDYHKDHWLKGLVGVVYEVTKSDFAHIIATEGGGSGYQDALVDCYALSGNPREKVPMTPSGTPFKAHTLFAPVTISGRRHAYAQPSARYLKLITDGAAEHSLPYEYQDFLYQIRTYRMTTNRQRLGQFVFYAFWGPLFAILFGGAAAIFLRPDGTYPKWFAAFANSIFTACWASYDRFYKPMFGEGERTIGDSSEDEATVDEKAPLIKESIDRYGIGGRLEMGL
jgi:hypothetical protein